MGRRNLLPFSNRPWWVAARSPGSPASSDRRLRVRGGHSSVRSRNPSARWRRRRDRGRGDRNVLLRRRWGLLRLAGRMAGRLPGHDGRCRCGRRNGRCRGLRRWRRWTSRLHHLSAWRHGRSRIRRGGRRLRDQPGLTGKLLWAGIPAASADKAESGKVVGRLDEDRAGDHHDQKDGGRPRHRRAREQSLALKLSRKHEFRTAPPRLSPQPRCSNPSSEV